MNPSALEILKEAGCEIPTEAPPPHFEVTSSGVGHDDDFSAQLPGESNLHLSEEHYGSSRSYYISQSKAGFRRQMVQEKREEITHVLSSGTKEDVQRLLESRRIWRQKLCDNGYWDRKICAFATCHNDAVEGSQYCLAHILKDPNQRLFAECPKCKRPYLIIGKCPLCNRDSH